MATRSYIVRLDNGDFSILVYNLSMQTKPKPDTASVERDPRLFMGFMTLVVVAMYIVTLVQTPPTRQIGTLIPFTGLLLVSVVLHWQVEKIAKSTLATYWYIIGQGALTFVIAWYSANMGMMFALFMALLGEAVGLLRLTRRGLLAGFYYLTLLVVSLVQFTGWASSGWLLASIVPIVFFVVIYVTLYMRQTEAREQAQTLAAELEAANRQLSEYAAQVEDLTIANERQRMARELHDTLSQGLAGLILQLEAVDAHLTGNRPEKARAIVSNAMEQARHTLTDARRAIDDLRRDSDDDLEAAIQREIFRFTGATGVPCDFHSLPTPPLPDSVKEAVIRSTGEALTNIAKHAQARHAAVEISADEKRLMVRIQDDGQGFDADAVPAGHYGLVGIRERVRLVNGTVAIQSKKGEGTVLNIEIPLPSPGGSPFGDYKG